VLNWQSPFELLHGTALDHTSLRTIGCLCFAANVGEHDKFEPRAHQCIFLGYTFGFKGYKLYHLQTKKIFHSQDVLFRENVFPFRQSEGPFSSNSSKDLSSSSLSPHRVPLCPLSSSSPPLPPSAPLCDSFSPHPPSPNDHYSLSSPHTSFDLSSFGSPALDTTVSATDIIKTTTTEEPPPRRSSRVKAPPTWLKDYICPQPPVPTPQQPCDTSSSSSHSFTSSISYPLFTFSHLAHLSAPYMASLVTVLQTPERWHYAQAHQYPEWVQAMQSKLDALEKN